MAFDPTKPVEGTEIDAAELRNQFNALKALVDAQEARIAAMELAMNGKANMPQLGEFDPSINDPPTAADLQGISSYIRQMAEQMMGVQW
jgi:hypothetical protein